MEAIRTFRRPLTAGDLEWMNIPPEFWRVKVQEVDESARKGLEKYLRMLGSMMGRGFGFIVQGAPGSGKTACGVLVAKEARALGYTGYFMPVWELRECMRAKVPFDDSMSVFDRCKNVDVLILDGLRVEDAKETYLGARQIEELIAQRGSRHRITIVTTRLELTEIRDAFPTLLETVLGCMMFVPLGGTNRRLAQNQEMTKTIFGS